MMIFTLSIGLLERLGLIILFAFLISKMSFFKRHVVTQNTSILQKVLFGAFWGALGILMTLMGEPVSGGVANSRTIPILVSGIIGGPLVGTLAGVIAGLHRMFFYVGGDLTAFSCGISTIVAGVIGGLYKKRIDYAKRRFAYGFYLGIFVEFIQMMLILLLARPFDQAYALVEVIFLPMTFLNAFGVLMFLLFIEQIYAENENEKAKMAHLSLQIANATLSHFRKGLNEQSAGRVAQIIMDLAGYDAVSITDDEVILAHVGNGADHHQVGGPIWTEKTRTALDTQLIHFGITKEEIGCPHADCHLSSVIVAPLVINDVSVGTFKVYRTKSNAMQKTDIELISGLATLFSTQLEASLIEKQKSLRAKAEMTALRAQIRPHFLFNTLNAIMSLTRTDPEKARQLLNELSIVLRNGFKDNAAFTPLKDEIRVIEAYLNIEKARFPEKIKTIMEINTSMDFMIPPLILQPLIENAIKHGLQPKMGPGTLTLSIYESGNDVVFEITDDGVGMPADFNPLTATSSGIGVKNVAERLNTIYRRTLVIDTIQNKGTKLSFKLPLHTPA